MRKVQYEIIEKYVIPLGKKKKRKSAECAVGEEKYMALKALNETLLYGD